MQTHTHIHVRGFHIDHFGHVNNARYLEFLEEGRWQYCEKNNLIEDLFHAKGIIHVVKEITIKYLKPATAGDILHVVTKVQSCDDKNINIAQTIFLKDTGIKIAHAIVTNTLFCLKTNTPRLVDQDTLAVWKDLNLG